MNSYNLHITLIISSVQMRKLKVKAYGICSVFFNLVDTKLGSFQIVVGLTGMLHEGTSIFIFKHHVQRDI